MKDKRQSKTTMRSTMNKSLTALETQVANRESSIHAFKYTPEYADQIKQYNLNLSKLDESYTSITPLTQVLVRCALNEPTVTESGLILPYKLLLSTNTKAGVEGFMEVETDWPYTEKAVVVSVPEHISVIKKGDTIQMTRGAVDIRIVGNGNNATPRIKNGFVRIDCGFEETPKNIDDPNYGYILIPLSEIQAKYV